MGNSNVDVKVEDKSDSEKLIDLLNLNHLFHTVHGVTRFMIRGLGTVDSNDLRTIADEVDRLNNVNVTNK